MKLEKILKKMTKRAAALVIAAAVIVTSVPQEYMAVYAAEMNEAGEYYGTDDADEGMQKIVPGPEETGSEETEQNETEAKETEPENSSSEASDTDETAKPSAEESETVTTEEPSSAGEETESIKAEEETEAESTETGEETEAEPAETDEETTEEPDDETGTTGEEATETETDIEKNPGAREADVPDVDRNDEYASGYGYDTNGNENTNVTWFLDKRGTLEVTGTGEVCRPKSSQSPPWSAHLNRIYAVKINLQGATSAYRLFEGCTNLTAVDLSQFDTSNLTSTRQMFKNCESLASLDLSGFQPDAVTDMTEMFYGCSALKSLNVGSWNTQNVENMENMFCNCSSLESLDLSNFDVAEDANMAGVFLDCNSLTNLKLGSLKKNKIYTMYQMFSGCSSLKVLDLSDWSIGSVLNAAEMFYGCSALVSLNLSGFNFNNCEYYYGVFSGCDALDSVTGPAKLTKNISLPSKGGDGISWRDSDGIRETTLAIDRSNTITLTTDKVGIALPEGNYTLQDEEGKTISLVVMNRPSGTKGEKVVDRGTKDNFTFTIVPEEGYVIKKVELASDESGTLALEKGSRPNQYTISPKDKGAGYTRDETVNVETEAIGEHTLTVNYKSFTNDIEDITIINGAQKQKVTGGTVQVSNNADTSFCVKLKAPANEGDPKEPVFYQEINYNYDNKKKEVPCLTDQEIMSGDEKKLYSEGYYIFRLGNVFEDIIAGIEVKFSRQEGDIAYGKEGDNTYWLIDQNGRLKIKGTGDLLFTQTHAWYEHRESVLSAVIEWSGTRYGTGLFNGCSNMAEVDLNGFHTDGMTTFSWMFNNCSSLKKLDLSGFDLSAATGYVSNVFTGCTSLEEIKTPRNVNDGFEIALSDIEGRKWRKADGTEISVLPRTGDESITITSNRTAVIFKTGSYEDSGFIVKDADGRQISMLLMQKGSKETQTVTIEAEDNTHVVGSMWTDRSDAAVSIMPGSRENQYVISPKDMEQGYTRDELICVDLDPLATYNVQFQYSNAQKLKDVIVANGERWVTGKPGSVQISNANHTAVYLKTDDEGMEIPEIRYLGQDMACITDTSLMNAREKELHQQGYYIFHLGRIGGNMSITVRLISFKKVQFATEGFPGTVRVIRYVNDGTASEPKWRGEVASGPLRVKKESEIYFRVEWEDTPAHEYKWCSPQFTTDTQTDVAEAELAGVEGRAQLVKVPDDMTIRVSLEPHTVTLDYMPGDLAEITLNNGARLSEDCMSVGVYSGDSFTMTVKLDNGLEPSSTWANDPNLSSTKNADGTYTISVVDMSKIRELTAINLGVYDPQNRIPLYDLEMNVKLTFKGVKGNPVYTGKPIEPQMPAAIAAYYRGDDGSSKPKTRKLKENTDYTWECVNNTDAGEAFVIITAVPSSTTYRGGTVIPFTIEKAKAPDAQQRAEQVEIVPGQNAYQVDLSEKFAADYLNDKNVAPVAYKIQSCEKGGVLAEGSTPVVEGDKLTYTLRIGANQNSEPAKIVFDASYKNYHNCQLTLTIQVVKKEMLAFGGTVTVADKVYDGMEILPDLSGLKVVSKEGAAVSEAEAAELLGKVRDTIAYRYTGVDGTEYDSESPPVDVGTYKIQAKVADSNTEYKSDYFDGGTFRISQRAVTLTADDVTLYLKDTIPSEYTCSADNLAEGDMVNAASCVICDALKTTETEGEYPIIVNAAAVKIIDRAGRDVTGNYIVSGKDGRLTVRKPEPGTFSVTYKGANPRDMGYVITRSGLESGSLIEKPNPPSAEGLTFLGWYKDEALTKEWNFDTDTVQESVTLYAGWLKAAQQGAGAALGIQEILPQTYTGKAVKPSVTVLSEEEEGSKRLQVNKDYKVEYKNNVNADTKTFANGVIPKGGIGENVDDTANGFDKRLPYVIITGKGSYTGKIYANFHIRAADISDAETAGSGIVLKYADQLDAKDSKYAAVVTQFKYKNKALKYNMDYALSARKQDSAASFNNKGQILLATGNYDVTITGQGNFTGEIRKQLYIADKSKLMKNAKITCQRTVSNPSQQELKDGIQPKDLVVELGGGTLAPDTDYTVACTDNHGIGTATVTVTAKEGSGYVGSKSVTFAIKGEAFKEKALQPLNLPDKVYTGKAVTLNLRGEQPDLTLTTADGRALEYGKDYMVSYKNNIRKGKATITFKALPASGYSGTFSKTFNIAPMNLEKAIVDGKITVTGAERTDSGWRLLEGQQYRIVGVTPSGAVSLELNANGTVLVAGKGKDYTISCTNNTAVGTGASMTLEGTGNYEGNLTISFEITKASLSQLYSEGLVTVTSKPVKASVPKRRVKVDDGDPAEGIPPEYEYQLINPEARFKPAVTVKDGKAALREGTDYELTYLNNTHQDVDGGSTASAVITGMGNYEGGSLTIPVTIYTRMLSAGKVRVEYEGSYTYTGGRIMPEPGVTYIIKAAKGNPESDNYEEEETEDLALGQDYRIEYGKNTAAGGGTIKIIGMGRYTGTVTKSFKITPKSVYNKGQSSPGKTE